MFVLSYFLPPHDLDLQLLLHVLRVLLVLLHLLLGLAHLLLEHVKNVAALDRVRHDVRHVAAGREERDDKETSARPQGVPKFPQQGGRKRVTMFTFSTQLDPTHYTGRGSEWDWQSYSGRFDSGERPTLTLTDRPTDIRTGGAGGHAVPIWPQAFSERLP